jgi:hypothetical protein
MHSVSPARSRSSSPFRSSIRGAHERDSLAQIIGLAHGDNLAVFVSPEIREREPIRRLQGVLVLRGVGPAAQDGEHDRIDHH